jgi:hypothetical protein
VMLDVANNSDGRLEVFGVNAQGHICHTSQTAPTTAGSAARSLAKRGIAWAIQSHRAPASMRFLLRFAAVLSTTLDWRVGIETGNGPAPSARSPVCSTSGERQAGTCF